MFRRTLGIGALAVLVAAAAAPTVAGKVTTTSKPRVNAVGGPSMVPNRYVKDGFRFNRDVYRVRSGATVTLTNKTREPHTLSIVKKSQVPRTLAGMDKCFSPNGVCGAIGEAHGATEESPPTIPLVNVGREGFNTAGDSTLLDPRGKVKFKVTASRGRSLYFLCALHPWMSGKFAVR